MRTAEGYKTGIVASIGRTFCEPETIREGIRAGALNFRLPLGLHDRDLLGDFRNIRKAAGDLDVGVDVLLDLPAARPRIGQMPNRVFKAGDRACVVDAKTVAAQDEKAIPLPGLLHFCADVKPGHRLAFRDGRQEFRVFAVQSNRLEVECITCTEPLRAANACSFPDSGLEFDAVRLEDREWLAQFAEHGLRPDWVAVSLVTEPAQIVQVREVLAQWWPRPPVPTMAKVETEEAIERLPAILTEADGVLLGRGDLGLNVPVERLPRIQEKVANEARGRVKLFTVATQILECFAQTGVPYRAELSDIALAVRQGAAALVLCQETNSSPRPVACIDLMRRVIAEESHRERH